jgi:nuclear pore complex protein Nup98-Nup96
MQSFSTFGGNSGFNKPFGGATGIGSKAASPLGAKGSTFGGFGQTSTSAFGQSTGGFGGGAKTTGFGQAAGGTGGGAFNSNFGSQNSTSFMSKASTGTSAMPTTFGAKSGFGAATQSFGGMNTSNSFGAKTGFGGAAPASGFGGFGQTQNQFQVLDLIFCCPLTHSSP